MEGLRSPQQHGAHPGSTPAPLIREGSWRVPSHLERKEGRACDTFHKCLCGQEGKMPGILRGMRSTFKGSFRTHSLMSDHWDILGAGRGAVSAQGQNFRYILVQIFKK